MVGGLGGRLGIKGWAVEGGRWNRGVGGGSASSPARRRGASRRPFACDSPGRSAESPPLFAEPGRESYQVGPSPAVPGAAARALASLRPEARGRRPRVNYHSYYKNS